MKKSSFYFESFFQRRKDMLLLDFGWNKEIGGSKWSYVYFPKDFTPILIFLMRKCFKLKN